MLIGQYVQMMFNKTRRLIKGAMVLWVVGVVHELHAVNSSICAMIELKGTRGRVQSFSNNTNQLYKIESKNTQSYTPTGLFLLVFLILTTLVINT